MSLILAEGFDVYGHNGNEAWPADSRWTNYTGASNNEIAAASGRGGGGAIRMGSNLVSVPFYGFAKVALGGDYSTLFAGFAFSCTPGAEGYYPFLSFRYGVNIQTCLYVASTCAIEVYDTTAGSLLGSSAVSVVTTGYQYWEVKVYCHASAGTVEIYIDGVQVLNLSGLDTQTYGSGGITHAQWFNVAAAGSAYIDDLVIYDDQGATFNDFVGDLAVIGHLPEADGADTDWTSTEGTQYGAVDNVGSGYGTNHIESSVDGHQDCFTVTSSGSYPSILGVEVSAHGYNSGGGTAKVTPYTRIGGVVYYGDELTMSAGSTDKRSYVWEANPATGTLWAKAAVTAAEFGFEVTEIS